MTQKYLKLNTGAEELLSGHFLLFCFYYRWRLLNESQIQNMVCLWFIPMKVVAAILLV